MQLTTKDPIASLNAAGQGVNDILWPWPARFPQRSNKGLQVEVFTSVSCSCAMNVTTQFTEDALADVPSRCARSSCSALIPVGARCHYIASHNASREGKFVCEVCFNYYLKRPATAVRECYPRCTLHSIADLIFQAVLLSMIVDRLEKDLGHKQVQRVFRALMSSLYGNLLMVHNGKVSLPSSAYCMSFIGELQIRLKWGGKLPPFLSHSTRNSLN